MSTDRGSMSLLEEGARLFTIELSSEQLSQFEIYSRLLRDWNDRLNLTAIIDADEIQVRHFLDSLSCSIATGDLNGAVVADGGTGAGFPGLPLKILFPKMRLTLIDSVAKKLRFLGAVVDTLGLAEVEIIGARLEEAGQDPRHRESYDWVLARGLAHMAVLIEYLLPLCRVGGHALAQKGEGVLQELEGLDSAIDRLGGEPADLTPIRLPGKETIHYLSVIRKVKATPPEYPRRPGIPSKRPIA